MCYLADIPNILISQPYLFVVVLEEGRRGRWHTINLSEDFPCYNSESIAKLG